MKVLGPERVEGVHVVHGEGGDAGVVDVHVGNNEAEVGLLEGNAGHRQIGSCVGQ